MKTNVEAKVAAFIRSKKPASYCDGCIAQALRLGAGRNRTMARNATSALAEAPLQFDRAKRTCDSCGKLRLAIRAV